STQGAVANSWGGVAYAFQVALAAVCSEHARRPAQDLLQYPIAYLARHWLELSLKGLWERLRREGDLPDAPPRTHRLNRIWRPIKAVLVEKVGSALDNEFCEAVEQTFRRFDQIDQRSDGFRYPPDVSAATKEVDVDLLAQEMERADTLFCGISAILDAREELSQSGCLWPPNPKSSPASKAASAASP